MDARPKPNRRIASENGDSPEDLVLSTLIGNGEDLGPIVRHAFEMKRPESLLLQLNSVVKKKEAEIEDLCKSHYEEFILAVDELRGVLVDAEELKGVLANDNFRLQEVGSALLVKLEELLEAYSIKKNLTEAIKMANTCLQVLELCSKCNDHISQGRFHPALTTIALIEKSFLTTIPVKSLRTAIEKTIPIAKAHIEKKTTSQFNEWLVKVRTGAKTIGQAAISHTESSRKRDQELLQNQRKTEESNGLVFSDLVFSLDISESEEDHLLNFDFTPLYRAYHIHSCLSIETQFKDYYFKNRMLQLNSDLPFMLNQPFIESHQAYLAHIAGYFIVEDRVLRTCAGVLSTDQVETMWDTAVSMIAPLLEEQFAQMTSAAHILTVKDSVILFALTLRQYGYETYPILHVLDGVREKYYALLLMETRSRIAESVNSDSYEQMVIRMESEYFSSVKAFNLHASEITPAFPFIAPFSAMVADICRLVKGLVNEAAEYASYSGGAAESFDAVRGFLDAVMGGAVVEVLRGKIGEGTVGLSQAMQLAANVSFLERACEYFVVYAGNLCGVSARVAERHVVSMAARAGLRRVGEEAYTVLMELVRGKMDEFTQFGENVGWTREDVPEAEGEYIKEVVMYVDTLLDTAARVLPAEAVEKLGCGAVGHFGDSMVAALAGEAVKRFNANAVAGLDYDLRAMEAFAEEKIGAMGGAGAAAGARRRLAEARQMVNLLGSSQPENFMNPVIRQKNYNALDYKKVAVVCDKFKDSADGLFGSLSNRSAKQTAKKKSMDMLKKRLKDFN